MKQNFECVITTITIHILWWSVTLLVVKWAQPNLTIRPAISPIIPSQWQADTNNLSRGKYCVSGAGSPVQEFDACHLLCLYFQTLRLYSFDSLWCINDFTRLLVLMVRSSRVYSGVSCTLSSWPEFPWFSTSNKSMSERWEVRRASIYLAEFEKLRLSFSSRRSYVVERCSSSEPC